MRKYSCSAPSVMETWARGWPNMSISRSVARDTAWTERSSGVFMSRVSPVKEQNAVGMQSVAPFSWRLMKAGDVGSHAV